MNIPTKIFRIYRVSNMGVKTKLGGYWRKEEAEYWLGRFQEEEFRTKIPEGSVHPTFELVEEDK